MRAAGCSAGRTSGRLVFYIKKGNHLFYKMVAFFPFLGWFLLVQGQQELVSVMNFVSLVQAAELFFDGDFSNI